MHDLRILIADDHQLIRRGVRDLLSARRGWHVAGEACNGAEAVEKTVSLRPDVVILDFSMPVMNGPQATESILRKLPGTPVVVLTMHDCDLTAHQVLRSGARGLVLKSDADRTLVTAVEAVAENRNFYTERASRLLLRGYHTGRLARSGVEPSGEGRLTEREEELMRLLAEGMTSKEAAAELHISIRTVESHRCNMGRKLGVRSPADLVRYAIRHGVIAPSGT
jgi:DNA-binding NarL/FixJ family response regulator